MECLESKILKIEMFEYWKLKFEISIWNVWNFKLHLTSVTKEFHLQMEKIYSIS